MKLSRTGWNNVIIFSVMMIIILINTTNDKLFPDGENAAEQYVIPEHSVILTLSITQPTGEKVTFERVGRSWQMTTQGMLLSLNEQQIEQTMFAWQQSTGLVQADDIIIDKALAAQVSIALADVEALYQLALYTLPDQVLIFNHQSGLWLSLPPALKKQLLPIVTP